MNENLQEMLDYRPTTVEGLRVFVEKTAMDAVLASFVREESKNLLSEAIPVMVSDLETKRTELKRLESELQDVGGQMEALKAEITKRFTGVLPLEQVKQLKTGQLPYAAKGEYQDEWSRLKALISNCRAKRDTLNNQVESLEFKLGTWQKLQAELEPEPSF